LISVVIIYYIRHEQNILRHNINGNRNGNGNNQP
jgi:hypothetical protein